ncbi:PREDICTED: serine protease gd-like [Vollenhovia emeryi]|uniref:serine protease gd-like n=1 Tax=Vollenhovia emeryi TaxID=411798 RepID=UPI0005F52FAE|nr:PREDICTED: serine protease gd-like [Vollenhovia emeryi]XP_011858547.1 PREDICTED: serine protease gd-like [Vollenhovia emeryi]XP_011858548.1 PREDICTED: serine protease gd-like [Vollenhovia emeryi]XP_011858549.1 PREDICTED: serine protease gd-like [Vollenhovia emeryi]XP_011858550.1 PREDICTED: serine protease gd-like [Vollenhovia emeryi]XP_011858551.1 PREDICTED: serine protease gd-like [Vollenhovia emeryi]
MAKICILFAFLSHLLCTMVHGATLCSEYFTHTFDPETGKIYGRIEIVSPPENDEFYLKVALNATAESLNGVFRIELARPIKDTVQVIRQGRSLVYHINFPSDPKLPTLSAIWFNNRQYCVGPAGASGSIIANIEVGHIVYLPNEEPLPQDFQPWHRNSSGYRIDNPYYNNNAECGVTGYYTDRTNKLIPDGETSLPGQWPWVVAIFVIETGGYRRTQKFRCGGSLLTNRHILTAGYCMKLHVTTSNETVPIDMLEVVLGRFNLNPLRGDRSANRKVASYVIHPDYVHYLKADSDLAVVTLKNVVEFTPLIRPICLWSGSSKLEDVVSRTGYVVGWGKDKFNRRDLDDQRMVRATIVSQEICLWTDSRFIFMISDNTFCAGSQDGLGPCHGDGGNGLILLNNITGSYELRGIVSRALPSGNSLCALVKYIIYVDVAKYIPWIQQQISM